MLRSASVFLALVALPACRAQQPRPSRPAGPPSWTLATFHDPATGVTFQYPAAFHPQKDVTGYFSPALTQIKGVHFHAKLAWVPPTPNPPPDEAWTDLGQLDFLYATLPEPTAAACAQLTTGHGENTGPPSAAIHGLNFTVGDVSEAGLSHFVSGKLYATFRSGTCHLFEQDTIGLDGYAGDVTQAQFQAFSRHLDAIFQTIRFPASSIAAAPANSPANKLYRDPHTGVSFQYPSNWLPNPHPDAIWMTEDDQGPHPPNAAFSMPARNPYAGTLLDGLTFSYAVHHQSTEAACLHSFTAYDGSPDPPTVASIHGIAFHEFDETNAGMCHDQETTIDVAYTAGRCLAFERDTYSQCPGAQPGRRPTSASQDRSIQQTLDNIMQSVRLDPQ